MQDCFMSKILWLKLETYSKILINNSVHAYAEHVEIMLFTWAMLLVPMVVPSLIVTLGRITTLPPIQTLLPIETGLAEVRNGKSGLR